MLSKIPTSTLRIVIAAAVGALYAVLGIIFIERDALMLILSFPILISVVFIVTGKAGFYRKLRYAVSFLLFQLLIGGLVYSGYSALDKHISEDALVTVGGVNRKLLILAMLVLISIGFIKLVTLLFSDIRSERNVKLAVLYKGKEKEFEAFVDSGNLAVDPFDKTPVMFVNKTLAESLLGDYAKNIITPSESDYELKKRLRIIPCDFGGTFKTLTALRADGVFLILKNKKEKISLLIAPDLDTDSFGGYPALVPNSVLGK